MGLFQYNLIGPASILDAGLFSLQLPVDMYHITGFGFSAHMADLNAFDYILQNLRCQFLNISIISKMGINLSSLHGSCKRSYLLQHIGIKHQGDDNGAYTDKYLLGLPEAAGWKSIAGDRSIRKTICLETD